jgi:hypothetical protein
MQQQYHIQLIKVTGMLVLAHQSTVVHTGTAEELQAVYKKVLIHNLLAGWWEIFAFFWNIIALAANARARRQLQKLTQENPTK